MIRKSVMTSLRELAISLGSGAEGTDWYLFGSVDRDENNAADIDLMILCKNDIQADKLRLIIDPDAFDLPLHLALMTFDEAAEVDAIRVQSGSKIYP